LQRVERHAPVQLGLGGPRIYSDRPAQQDFGLLIVFGVRLVHAEQMQRIEMLGRKLQQLTTDRLGIGEQSGLMQLNGAIE